MMNYVPFNLKTIMYGVMNQYTNAFFTVDGMTKWFNSSDLVPKPHNSQVQRAMGELVAEDLVKFIDARGVGGYIVSPLNESFKYEPNRAGKLLTMLATEYCLESLKIPSIEVKEIKDSICGNEVVDGETSEELSTLNTGMHEIIIKIRWINNSEKERFLEDVTHYVNLRSI